MQNEDNINNPDQSRVDPSEDEPDQVEAADQ